MSEIPETPDGLGDLIELFLYKYAHAHGSKAGRLARDAVLDTVSKAFNSIGEVLYESENNQFWLQSAKKVKEVKNAI